MRRSRVLASVLSLLVVLLISSADASARVPQGFVGMMPAPPIYNGAINLGAQLDKMVATGVESLRLEFVWAAMQPYAKPADVPPSQAQYYQTIGGVPTSFGLTDKIVGLAAQRGLPILSTVLVTPDWAAATHIPSIYNLPKSNATFAAFMQALIGHYGPHGTFWRQNPKIKPVPIRVWQIWNEPNLQQYWPTQPFEHGYVALLRAAHDAIKRADHGAKVILAGMPNASWDYIDKIYQEPGAQKLFDAVAVHPFTTEPAGVITILQRVRDVMNRHGDSRKPIIASEISWPSSLGKTKLLFGFESNEAGQARNISAALPLLAANRKRLGLQSFYWYTWVGRDVRNGASFEFAGLFRYANNRFIVKPAYNAFRRAALKLENCSVKGPVANRCRRR